MTVIESAVQWAINTANDNSHGYSQASRWGPDYDCSSFVITAYEQAGVRVKEAGASYTGNMRGAFISCGFVDVTNQVGLSSGYGIQAGDVLLNYSAHTCMSIGNGKVANCRTSEGNYQTGDQSGNEIRIQSYWDGSPNKWNCVLRYKGNQTVEEKVEGKVDSSTKPVNSPTDTHIWKPPVLHTSNAYSTDCVVLQALLNVHHWACGSCDGFYGPKTTAAVNKAKAYYGMKQDGTCDSELWDYLLRRK